MTTLVQQSRRGLLRWSLAGGAAVALAAPRLARAEDSSNLDDGLGVLNDDGRFMQWLAIIRAAGMERAAQGRRTYTAFVPTDEAFVRYPFTVKDILGENGAPSHQEPFPDTSLAALVVRTHVVSGKHAPGEYSGKDVKLTSLAGTPIELNASDPQSISVTWAFRGSGTGRAKVSLPPLIASNAVIYPLVEVDYHSA